MNAKQKQTKLFGILVSLFILYSCSTNTNPLSGPWQVVGFYDEHQSIMTAGFLDETHVVTGGVIGQMAYSSDAAETWLETDSQADCRYGIEIVSPEVIWTCGGATNVRKSIDSGQTWQMLAAFGDPRTITNPCHSMSFLDEKIGWLANSNLFGTTTNGGLSWNMHTLPETANKIATIDTYLPNEGYLLDQNGVLFFTQDDGAYWNRVSQLDLGELKMSFSVYQLAAMRFADANHGLIVVSSSDSGKGQVIAFHTTDGGQIWTSEVIPVIAGPVYLSREGNLLTVITGANQLTLLRYEE
ncbi:MAG: hypothetical protein H7Y59_02505 [Anaerolineales bacterium]|nr:hypothetical protein [Anaerolineales bacterium]